MTKVGYDELGLKLLKNVTHSLEEVDLRYSLKRTKTLFFVRSSSSPKVAREILEKTEECVSDEIVRRERHRQGLKPTFACDCKATEDRDSY